MNIYNTSMFLNAASAPVAIAEGITLFSKLQYPIIKSITGGDGEVIVETIQGGEKVTESYSDLQDAVMFITCDPNTPIHISGDLVSIEIGSNGAFTSISVKNTALTQLDCSDCDALTSLNLSANTALTQLDCSYCVRIDKISTLATNRDVSDQIASLITANAERQGTVHCSDTDTYYSVIETAANDANWTIAPIEA